MLSLLIWLLVLVLIFGIVVWIVQLMPIPAPFGQVALAIVGLIFVLIIVSALLGDFPIRSLGMR
jgi:hypothetical protein